MSALMKIRYCVTLPTEFYVSAENEQEARQIVATQILESPELMEVAEETDRGKL